MSKIKMDEKFNEGLIKHLVDEQHIAFQLDEFDSDDVTTVGEIVTGVFQYIGKHLAENKSETEPVTLELPGYIEFMASFREGNGDGNWGIGITAGPELKKYIKGDEEAEDLINDEE